MNKLIHGARRNILPCTANCRVASTQGIIAKVLMAGSRLCHRGALAITVVAALGVGTGTWGTHSAQAAGQPPLILTLTGPQNAAVTQPLEGINIQLVNPGQDKPSSRLRLLVHDGLDRDLGPDDIRIEVREGNAWNSVTVEAIDGGIIGAIGEAGAPHNKIHNPGGFAIAAKASKHWQLRVTFRLAGSYTLVAAVSPDNGSTHLAQPVSLNVEAL